MDFHQVVSRAKLWISTNPHGLAVNRVREEERKIDIFSPTSSFFITVPEAPGDEWGIWSDEEDCISLLSKSMDQLSHHSNTIEILLERAAVAMHAPGNVGVASIAGEEEEEDDSQDNSEGEEFDDYYGDEENLELDEPDPDKSCEEDTSAMDFFTGQGSPAAVHRLLADLKSLTKSSSKYGLCGSPVKNNLFSWEVELSDFPSDSLLAKDLAKYAAHTKRKPVITMEMSFPKDYPMNPPFVRIIRPRFKFLTGHVTIGGSICMQMLTRSGWSPSNDIESILVQIRAEIMSDPNTRLELSRSDVDYSEQEAKAAFERMVMKYGWSR